MSVNVKEIMKIKLPKDYELTGPYAKYSAPFGIVSESLNRVQWFVSRAVPKTKTKDPCQVHYQKYGKTIGRIERFDRQKHRYIIPQTFPLIEFNTLQKTINYLIKNEGKIIYCS